MMERCLALQIHDLYKSSQTSKLLIQVTYFAPAEFHVDSKKSNGMPRCILANINVQHIPLHALAEARKHSNECN